MFNTTNKKKPLGIFGGGVAINKDEVDAQNGWGDRTDLTRGEESDVKSYGEFTYNYQDQLNDVISQILGREKFKYDLDGDALYRQYADKYAQQGRMAMMDTMGQAQAMTGGYANSYAQTAGQQAYQAQLQDLNDIVPEFYQMALDRYKAEGDELLDKYKLITDDYDRKYGEYLDKIDIQREDERFDAVYGKNDTVVDNNTGGGNTGGGNTGGTGETKGYYDFNSDTHESNVKANGGSYYKSALGDLKQMKASGKSNKEVQAYLEELVGNSIITKSEYATLYNKYRNNELG